MSMDLVRRLRFAWQYDSPAPDLAEEAAVRIEELSAARTDLCERIEDLEAALKDSSHWLGEANERIEVLEDALREIADRRCYGTEDCRNIARCALEAKS